MKLPSASEKCMHLFSTLFFPFTCSSNMTRSTIPVWSRQHPTGCQFAGNGNGLLYCILFMIYIDRFSSALWAAHCHFPAWIQTSIFLSSAIRWKLSPVSQLKKSPWKPRSDSTVGHSLRWACAKATLGHSSPLPLQQPPGKPLLNSHLSFN